MGKEGVPLHDSNQEEKTLGMEGVGQVSTLVVFPNVVTYLLQYLAQLPLRMLVQSKDQHMMVLGMMGRLMGLA